MLTSNEVSILLFSDTFYIKETVERNCELRLKSSLDYETTRRYEIEIQMKTSSSLIDLGKSIVRVTAFDGRISNSDIVDFSVTGWRDSDGREW